MQEAHLILFVTASLVLIATPGQDMLLVISRSVSHGSRAGVLTAAGVCTGLLGHTFFAACGLGVIIQASETLFLILKLLGAVYLVYLGIKSFVSKPDIISSCGEKVVSRKKMYTQGVISNISNPKIVVFYMAFLPQFLPEGVSEPALLLVFYGVLYAFMAFVVKSGVAFFAGFLSVWLKENVYMQQFINKLSGVLLVFLGLRLALSKRIG